MLAQNFKTAEELGISEATHAAAVKVLGMFERDEIPQKLFNMRYIGRPACGSAGCIYGWIRVVDKAIIPPDSGSNPIYDLFVVNDVNANATPAHAATALRNYLVTGKPDWEKVMELA